MSSPSAEVQGHSPAERKVLGGKRNVAILGVEPVGNYAVKLTFDDMHDTGLYGWGYLHELGRNYVRRWETYLGELAERGLDRDTVARQVRRLRLGLLRLPLMPGFACTIPAVPTVQQDDASVRVTRWDFTAGAVTGWHEHGWPMSW